jgi:hypothetical protein
MMSERIRELANKAGMWKVLHFPHLTKQEENAIEKFAELIVRECADLCLKHAEYEGPFNTMEYRKGQHFNTIIKKHFGVE